MFFCYYGFICTDVILSVQQFAEDSSLVTLQVGDGALEMAKGRRSCLVKRFHREEN